MSFNKGDDLIRLPTHPHHVNIKSPPPLFIFDPMWIEVGFFKDNAIVTISRIKCYFFMMSKTVSEPEAVLPGLPSVDLLLQPQASLLKTDISKKSN